MSEKTDIVERLRYGAVDWASLVLMAGEAADKIEQLRLERDRAKEEVVLLRHEVRW
jgi:hypothetical protein